MSGEFLYPDAGGQEIQRAWGVHLGEALPAPVPEHLQAPGSPPLELDALVICRIPVIWIRN